MTSNKISLAVAAFCLLTVGSVLAAPSTSYEKEQFFDVLDDLDLKSSPKLDDDAASGADLFIWPKGKADFNKANSHLHCYVDVKEQGDWVISINSVSVSVGAGGVKYGGTEGGNDGLLLDPAEGKPKNKYDGDSFNQNPNFSSWKLQYAANGGDAITQAKLKHDYLDFLDVWGELADHLEDAERNT